MRFNFFEGKREFIVIKDQLVSIELSTSYAQKRVSTFAGNMFTPDPNVHRGQYGIPRNGQLLLPAGTQLELLGYTMPFYESAHSVKIKLCFKDTGTKLGTFYAYTNIQSLEKIELEPCK
jgi:hypothetical protein